MRHLLLVHRGHHLRLHPGQLSPFATTSITFLVGGGLLALAFGRRIAAGLKKDAKKQLLRCLFLSAVNSAYNTMYQFGLESFDVSTGAFTLSLTVVALPIIMLAQRSKVDKRTWLSAALVLTGIATLLIGMLTRSQLPGLGIIAAGCVLRAFYIIKLNQFAREHDPVVLSTLICLSGGVLSYLCWLLIQPGTFLAVQWSPIFIASLAIYSYFVVALIYPSVDAELFALTVLLNTAAFPLVFGIPTMILMQEELGFQPVKRRPRP